MIALNLEKEFLNKSNCGTGIVYNKETELFDVSLDIKTEHLIKVTWKELVDLKNLSALEPGVFYRITDYEFTSTDPEVISAGHRFDIIVLALSEDTLSEDARAIQHEFTEEEKEIYSEEEQHYFDKSNLSAWKLKYSLDGDSKRFTWAPSNMENGIIVNNPSIGAQTLYRNTNKDEGIYYAFSNDNYTYYTTSEEPIEGDLLYEKKDNLIKEMFSYTVSYGLPMVLYLVDNNKYTLLYLDFSDNYVASLNDAYTIDISQDLIYWNNTSYIILNNNYNFSYMGEEKVGILVKRTYSYKELWFNGYPIWLPLSFKDYILSGEAGSPFPDSYSIALTKKPEIGDSLDITYGDDSYVPFICSYLGDEVLYKITHVDNYTLVSDTFSKNTTYRGTIYGMIDEYENDCEYDFKNALITGKYSLFNPDLFYYTFTNQGSLPSLLKHGDDPILLYPGTYSFLGCMPFRYYEDNPYLGWLKITNKSGEYNEWDLYAAICDTEGYIDETTGEKHYKVNMYAKHGYENPDSSENNIFGFHQMVKIFEDRLWYIKEPLPNNVTYEYNPIIYCKYNNSIEEFNSAFYFSTESKYFHHYKSWIYDCCFQKNKYILNLNYNASDYNSEGNDFDISINSDTYANDINSDYTYLVTNNFGLYGILQEIDLPNTQNIKWSITWIKLGLPVDYSPSEDSYSQVISDITYKFTKPITITEPMYVYLSQYNTTAKYADAYVLGDVMLSPKKIIGLGDIGYDIYATNKDYSELNGDLYAWPFNVINPTDTSCAYSYYDPDCYKVTLRTSYFNDGKYIPKVIMDNILSSTIEARNVFLQDCYCVKARNGDSSGYPYGNTFGNYYSYNPLFLRRVYLSELLDADECTIEDCYSIIMSKTLNSYIKKVANSNIFNNNNVYIQTVGNSTIEHCEDITLLNLWGSHLFNCCGSFSEGHYISSFTNSILNNITRCTINTYNLVDSNSSPSEYLPNVYINGINNKVLDLTSSIGDGAWKYRCTHIRSEDDLTITI